MRSGSLFPPHRTGPAMIAAMPLRNVNVRRNMFVRSFFCFCLLCISTSVLSGCGGTEGLGRVSGKVTLDGKPLADASIEFVPVGGTGLTSYGRTDANGEYYMMATRTEKGAAIGKNSVRITTYEVLDMKNVLPERVPTKYNSATELEREVQSGSNTLDFDLSSEGGKIVNKAGDGMHPFCRSSNKVT